MGKTVVVCGGNATHMTNQTEKHVGYTIRFVNDGTEISFQIYHYDDKVVESTTPTKESDDNYTFIFAGWNSEIANCEGDKVYTATYTTAFK